MTVVDSGTSRGDSRSVLSPRLQRRNVIFLGLDLGLFMAALGLVAPLTLVPLFVSKLTSDPLAVGAVSAMNQLGWLPQVFAVGYVESRARKLPMALIFSGLERIPILGLALCAFMAPVVPLGAVLALVYLCCFSSSVAAGLATTPWMEIIAKSIPPRWRGRFMGGFMTIGQLLGAIAAAALAVPLLDGLPFPYGFAACFGIAFLILMVGYLPLFMVVEPPGPAPRAVRPFGQQISDLVMIVAGDAAFGRYLIGLCLTALGMMSVAGFLVVFGVSRLGATDEQAGWYTAALLAAQVAGTMAFGWLADRRGYMLAARLAALAGVGMAGVALAVGMIAPTDVSPMWIVPAFILLGTAFSGMMLTRFTGPLEFAPAARRPSYVALASSLTAIVAAAAPLVGGYVIAQWGYEWLFGASMVISLAGAAALRTQD